MIGTLYECIAWLTTQDPEKRYEVRERKRRRSLTANAYYWVIINKLARALQMPDSEVHLNILRDYGRCDVLALSMHVEPSDYLKYYDEIGVDFVDGEEMRVVKAYKPSHLMDSTEFSHLIGGLREECVLQGIDVATPEELSRMRFVETERT